MDGLDFITLSTSLPPEPARADVACFVGMAGRRSLPAPTETARLERALRKLGWRPEPVALPLNVPDCAPLDFGKRIQEQRWTPPGESEEARRVARSRLFEEVLPVWFNESTIQWFRGRGLLQSESGQTAKSIINLLDVPVPVESWDEFDRLFEWERRGVDGSERTAHTWLGAAIKAYFRHGGRKCYVVRVGEPFPVSTPRANCSELASMLLKPRWDPSQPTALDRRTWRGVGHLFGLPEVSMLCLPDSPDLFALDQPWPVAPEPSLVEEHFIECSSHAEPKLPTGLRTIQPPRCDEQGFVGWSQFINGVKNFLVEQSRKQSLPPLQLIAALPLAANTAALGIETSTRSIEIVRRARAAQLGCAAAIQSAFVQLTYPWLATNDSLGLPGGLESPDAALAGILAEMALTRGAWRTPARDVIPALRWVEPVLARAETEALLDLSGTTGSPTLREHVSLFGPAAGGVRLISDCTTSASIPWRAASVNRLMNIIMRAARLEGDRFNFANNGEMLWAEFRDSIGEMLGQLWADGALAGVSAAESFEVRCDRSTMTQQDLDAGRVIARVQFVASTPLQRIVVAMAMSEGGTVTLRPLEEESPARKEAA
jgi:hypothetical protein